jgi:hypothetical protein
LYGKECDGFITRKQLLHIDTYIIIYYAFPKYPKGQKSKNPQKVIFKKIPPFDQIYLYIQDKFSIFREIKKVIINIINSSKIKVMKTETKELLKDQIQEVNKSRTSFIVGAVMVTLDIVLVLSSVLNTYSLILVLPLVYVVRRQFILYKIKNSSLALMESLIEGKFKLTKKA